MCQLVCTTAANIPATANPGTVHVAIDTGALKVRTTTPAWVSVGGGGGGAPTSTVGGIQVDDGAGGWSNLAHSGGGADEYPYGPAGGGAVAFRAGVPAGDITPQGAPSGQDMAAVGSIMAFAGAPPAGWSSVTAMAMALNGMVPFGGVWAERT